MFSAFRIFFGSQAGMVLLIFLAAVLGGAYLAHVIQVGTLEKTIKDQGEQITSLSLAKSKLESEKQQLLAANKDCSETVDRQNKAIQDLVTQKSANDAAYRGAVASANKNAELAQKTIQGILEAKPLVGENWCVFWERQVDAYIAKRQKK